MLNVHFKKNLVKSTLHILFFIAVSIIFSAPTKAHAYLEINGFYNTDNFKNSSQNNNSQMLYDASIGFAIDKKAFYLAGWNYTGHSTTKTTTTTESYSSTQMGPKFIFFFGKPKMFSLGLAYNIQTKATFNNGTQTYTWKGTGLKADFGVNFPIGETTYFGLRLNYASASYNEQLVGGSSYTQVSYTRVFMYPSIYMFFGF